MSADIAGRSWQALFVFPSSPCACLCRVVVQPRMGCMSSGGDCWTAQDRSVLDQRSSAYPSNPSGDESQMGKEARPNSTARENHRCDLTNKRCGISARKADIV